jgi:hypothetical protein
VSHRVPFRRLDLDDLGSAVDEQLRAIGTRDLTRKVENADSGQALRHRDTFVCPGADCRPEPRDSCRIGRIEAAAQRILPKIENRFNIQ